MGGQGAKIGLHLVIRLNAEVVAGDEGVLKHIVLLYGFRGSLYYLVRMDEGEVEALCDLKIHLDVENYSWFEAVVEGPRGLLAEKEEEEVELHVRCVV